MPWLKKQKERNANFKKKMLITRNCLDLYGAYGYKIKPSRIIGKATMSIICQVFYMHYYLCLQH